MESKKSLKKLHILNKKPSSGGNKSSRDVSTDLLECIAILLVVLYHSTLYSYDIVRESSNIDFIRYLFRTMLSPCVALFFFANGNKAG